MRPIQQRSVGWFCSQHITTCVYIMRDKSAWWHHFYSSTEMTPSCTFAKREDAKPNSPCSVKHTEAEELFRFFVLYWMWTEEQKRRRPWNEATYTPYHMIVRVHNSLHGLVWHCQLVLCCTLNLAGSGFWSCSFMESLRPTNMQETVTTNSHQGMQCLNGQLTVQFMHERF